MEQSPSPPQHVLPILASWSAAQSEAEMEPFMQELNTPVKIAGADLLPEKKRSLPGAFRVRSRSSPVLI